MTIQLAVQIIGLSLIGMVLFFAVAKVVTDSAEKMFVAYFAAKMSYALALHDMMEQPGSLRDIMEAMEKRRSDGLVAKDS